MSLGGSDHVVVTGCHVCMGSLLSFGRNTYHGTDCSEWVWADSDERDVVREVSAPEGFSVGFVLGYFRSSKERGGQRLDVRDQARFLALVHRAILHEDLRIARCWVARTAL